MAAMCGIPIIANETLLFIDEIQESQAAIMALRYFKEDMPGLHVIAAGSLLEFVLDDIPTFGVGRIHSMYMYPMTFDEFLLASGEQLLIEVRRQANADSPLPTPLHDKLVGLIRTIAGNEIHLVLDILHLAIAHLPRLHQADNAIEPYYSDFSVKLQ